MNLSRSIILHTILPSAINTPQLRTEMSTVPVRGIVTTSIPPGGTVVCGGAGLSKGKAQNAALLLLSLRKFYAQGDQLTKILPIINGKSDISLRLIDWFITNFSKKHNTTIVRAVPASGSGCTKDKCPQVVRLNVFAAYRAQLKSYSKTHFDPFRRRDRIRFHYTKEDYIDTTIGQLNLFRWVLSNDILSYIVEHKPEIEEDMIMSQRELHHKTHTAPSSSAATTKDLLDSPSCSSVSDTEDDKNDSFDSDHPTHRRSFTHKSNGGMIMTLCAGSRMVLQFD